MLASLGLLLMLAQGPTQTQRDLDALTQGVVTVAKPGIPGVVSAIAADAVPFLISNDGNVLVPVASAGRLGKGRAVGFGHGGYLGQGAANEGDTGRLLANVIRWCSGGKSSPRVGVLQGDDPAWIRALGFEAVPIARGTLAKDLEQVDVAVIPASFDSETLEQYVRGGGGLITAHTPWGWMQLNPGKDLATQMPMQGLLHRAGLSFSDGYSDRIWPAKSLEEATRANAMLGLQRLSEDPAQASATITAALRSTTEREEFHRQVRLAVAGVESKVPTTQNPLLVKDALPRLALTVRWLDRQAGREAPEIEPSAGDFPGAVPADAPRVDAEATVPVNRQQWVSTGLYAAPGEAITVVVPEGVAGKGIGIQIGCHTDTIWHMDKWQRHPEITVRMPLVQAKTRLSSPFGGLVYVVVDRGLNLPDQKVRFSNVVRSARYVHGQTTPAEWRRQLEHAAPWAEIGSEKIVFSVPIEDARRVEDPVALMDLWDKTMDLFSDLDGSPLFDRPERIVCDRQISAGYMHSGYPIMTWMDRSIELSLSVKQLTSEGSWGHWHELGHNRQRGEWTFGGAGEVTNNIFTVYIMSRIAGKDLFDRIGSEKAKVEAYLAKGGDFEQWKREPFLALTMYGLLIRDFGWDSMKRYFRSYLGPQAGALPRTDLEKHDQFMVRYSKVVGRNLGPYFQAWGVPTSEAARDSVRSLPTWMPKEI